MKPKLMLTIASIYFLLDGFAGFFMVSGFDFIAYAASIFTMAFGLLFWMTRNAPPSKTLNAVIVTSLLSSLAVGLLGIYAQWSGNFMDSPVGYLPPLLWLVLAAGFFVTRRANVSANAN